MTLQKCEDKNLNSIILGLVIRCIITKKSATNIKYVPGRRGKGGVKPKIYKNIKWRGGQSQQIRTQFFSSLLYMFNNTFFCCFVREVIYCNHFAIQSQKSLVDSPSYILLIHHFLSVFVCYTNKRQSILR